MSYEMQKIRNKSLQRKYINFSIMLFNNKALNNLQYLKSFNYYSLIRFKYYLMRRANNVLWVKTRYLKSNYQKNSKVGFYKYNQGLYSNDPYTTY